MSLSITGTPLVGCHASSLSISLISSVLICISISLAANLQLIIWEYGWGQRGTGAGVVIKGPKGAKQNTCSVGKLMREGKVVCVCARVCAVWINTNAQHSSCQHIGFITDLFSNFVKRLKEEGRTCM